MYQGSEYTSITLHNLRQQELMRKAEQERLAKERPQHFRRLRRLRINND